MIEKTTGGARSATPSVIEKTTGGARSATPSVIEGLARVCYGGDGSCSSRGSRSS